MLLSRRLRSLLATAIGQVGEGVLAFLCVPIFVAWLGKESWGLVALLPVVSGLLAVAGFPLATAVNRELSRLATAGSPGAESRRVLRVVEALFLLVAAAGAAAIWIAAPWIVRHWLSVVDLSDETCIVGIRVIGIAAAVLLVRSAHLGALYGLQRIATANALTLGTALAVSAAGLLAAGPWRSQDPGRTVVWFLGAQCVLQAVGAVVVAVVAWRSMPAGGALSRDGEASPERGALASADAPSASGPSSAAIAATWRRLWPFIRGTIVVAAAGGVLSQLDRLVVSRLLPLDEFGRYSIAAMLAGGVALLVRAVNMASFPDLSRAFAGSDAALHALALRRWTRAAGLVAIPAAATMAAVPRESLTTWLGAARVDQGMSAVLAALAVGWGFNGLAAPAFSAALAAGWTRFAAIQNMVALALMPLVMVVLVPRLGPLGAALAWTALNIVYVLWSIPALFFPRLLPGEARRWLGGAVLPPLIGAGGGAALTALALPEASGRLECAAVTAAVACAALTGAALGLKFAARPDRGGGAASAGAD